MSQTIADVITELDAVNKELKAANSRASELSRTLNLALARSGPVAYVPPDGCRIGYRFDGAERRIEYPAFEDRGVYPDASTVLVEDPEGAIR